MNRTIPPAALPGRHASFLASCSIGGIRVALAPEGDIGQAEFKAATDKLRQFNETMLRKEAEQSKKLAEYDARIADAEQKAARRGGGFGGPVGDGFGGGNGLDLGAQVAGSDALREFKAANYRGTSRLETKATITTGSVGGVLGGMVAPDRAGVQPMARRPLTIRSLCQSGRTESNIVTLMVQEARVNAAAVAPEATVKGEGSLTYVEKAFKVATLATWVPASRQVLEDAVGLQSLINGELRYNLQEREEDLLLYSNGVGDNWLGLIPSAQTFVAPFPIENATPFDRLLQGLAQVSIANFRPSAIVLNTADAFRLHSLKESGTGRYIAGGPNEAMLNLLFGIPWVSSNGIEEGEFLIGDFSAAEIYDRMDAVVEISDSHAEFFTRNLYVIRCEQRLAFVIRDPRAFVHGTLVEAA